MNSESWKSKNNQPTKQTTFSQSRANIKTTKHPDIFLLFANQHLEHHATDGSILAWKGSQIVYISAKGMKNCLSAESIIQNQELSQRVTECIDKYNKYCTQHEYYRFPQEDLTSLRQVPNNYKLYLLQGRLKDVKTVSKPFKIQYFSWENAEIQEQPDEPNGFTIYSDQRTASLTLHSNLYTITVRYLQYMASSSTNSKNINYTKILLQKYNYDYTEFPQTLQPEQQKTTEHQYIEHQKSFCIFNAPYQWRYPLDILWRSLIEQKVFTHQFCYLEFQNHQMCKKIPMPPLSKAFTRNTKQNNMQNREDQGLRIPILGKTTHGDYCHFIKIDDFRGWYTQEVNILNDGIGFWMMDGSSPSIFYRKYNRMLADEQFHPHAIPFKIRFEGQKQRSVTNQIKLFLSYFHQNKKQGSNLQNQQKCKNSFNFDNQGKLVSERQVQGVGQFKAYSNGIVYIKFVDRCILTLNSKKMDIKLMDGKGQTHYIVLGKPDGHMYRLFEDYINYSIDFNDQVFFPGEWEKKRRLRQEIDHALLESQTLQKINKLLIQ